jgi:hypothetical protein
MFQLTKRSLGLLSQACIVSAVRVASACDYMQRFLNASAEGQ